MNRLTWLGVVLLGLGIVVLPALAVEESPYIVRNFNASDGLSQNTINAMLQTADGYLWLATQEGLSRFDGVTFRNFVQFDPKSYNTGFVTALGKGRNDSLLIGLSKDGVIRLERDRFAPVGVVPDLANATTRAIVETGDGTLWIGADNGLFQVTNGKIRRYGIEDGLGDPQVFSLLPDNQGGLWIGTAEGGLSHLQENRITTRTTASGLPDNRVRALMMSPEGDLVFGAGASLCTLRQGQLTTHRFDGVPPEDFIRTLTFGPKGTIWAGFYTSGLRVHPQMGSDQWLPFGEVLSSVRDHEGNVWVGCGGSGLYSFQERFTHYLGEKEGLTKPVLWSVLQSRDGAYWLATNGAGVALYREGRMRTFTTGNGFPSLVATSICQTRDETIWVGDNDGRLSFLHGDRFTTIQLGERMKQRIIYSIFEDSQGRLWVATGQGLFYSHDRQRFTRLSTREGLVYDSVRRVSEDRNGTLWILTDGGLSKYQGGKFVNWSEKEGGLPATGLLSIEFEESGHMWLGSRFGGLIHFDGTRFTPITSRHGLFNDIIFSIVDDRQGHYWMSCNKGVFYVAKEELSSFVAGKIQRIRSFPLGVEDGLTETECNGGRTPSGILNDRGELCFPTMAGMLVIKPGLRKKNMLPPPLRIESIRFDQQEPVVTFGKSPLLFGPGRGEIELQYTALSFVNPRKVMFRYRLEGYDRDWVEAGTRRTAYYTNLAPGKYTFRVTACNNDEVWHPTGVPLEIVIRPAFYQTAWFRWLLVLLLGSIVAGAVALRIRALHRKGAELTRLVAERTLDLRQANSELATANETISQANSELRAKTDQLQHLNLQLERLSHLDGLTGIHNRRYFEEHLALEWRRACRRHNSIAIIMVDVDFFKLFNDRYGHLAGDECLKKVAEALAIVNRPGDLLARYGGEEFIIVLPDTDLAGAQLLGEKMRRRVAETGIAHEESTVSGHVTISVGLVASVPEARQSPNDFVLLADEALYKAKRSGRNRVETI